MNKLTGVGVLVFCAIFSLFSALPPDSIVIEAETLTLNSKSWRVRPHFLGWYQGKPSGGKMLNGFSKTPGSVSGKFTVAKPGRYRIWARYLDVRNHPASFVITVSRNGKVMGTGELNKVARKSVTGWFDGNRARAEDVGPCAFIWDAVEFEADVPGEYQLKLAKGSVNKGSVIGSRHIDCLLITRDLNFKPLIGDLYPVFIKIRVLRDAEKPYLIHFFGKRGYRPPYMRHMNINKAGVYRGIGVGFSKRSQLFSKAGDESPWIDISSQLGYGGFNVVELEAVDHYRNNQVTSADFEVLVSTGGNDSTVVKRFVRKGSGNLLNLCINHENNTISDDLNSSAQSLKFAQAVAGNIKQPRLFPMLTGNVVEPARHQPATVANEINTMKLLGVNGINRCRLDEMPQWRVVKFLAGMRVDNCAGRPDLKKIDAAVKEVAERTKDKAFVYLIADEPSFEFAHVLKCSACAADFSDYLKTFAPGVSGKLTASPEQPELYYWSRRFRNWRESQFFAACTRNSEKYAPKLPVTVNFGLSLIGGNMTRSGCDWFEIMRSNALTYGWHEDWANHSANYQVNGFQTDVLRAACRTKGQKFGMYNILGGRSAWEIEAKTYLHIAHGCKAISFFNYGPHYMVGTDDNSIRTEIYPAIRNSTAMVAEHEKFIMGSSVAKGDAAMLMSVTGDIWNEITDSIYGRERIYLSLLLRHCGIRTDILDENDLATELQKYPVLFALDSHIRRSQLGYITKWVENGGILYLGAGALQFDEYNRPLPMPVKREKYRQLGKVSSAQYGLPKLKAAEYFQTMPVIGAMQKPYLQEVKLGKGKIILCGFFPGLSYQYASTKVENMPYSIRNYPEAHRKFIKSLPLGIVPRIASNNYRVEAGLLENGKDQLIVLSNWSGKPCEVEVKLDGKTRKFTVNAGGIYK